MSNAKGGRIVSVPANKSWKAFDALPPSVRAALADGVVPWNPVQVLAIHNKMLKNNVSPMRAEMWSVKQVESSDTHDVLLFSREHKRRFGFASPHVAAGASILRSRA